MATTILGIDLGSYSVKVARLDVSFRSMHLISLEEHRLVPHDLSYVVSSDYYTDARIYQDRRGEVLLLDYELAQTPIGGASFTARHPLLMLRDHYRIQTEVLRVPPLPKWLSLMRKALVLGAIRIIQILPGRA